MSVVKKIRHYEFKLQQKGVIISWRQGQEQSLAHPGCGVPAICLLEDFE